MGINCDQIYVCRHPSFLSYITGSFQDDLDLCELFCRIELYCDAWVTVRTTRTDVYGDVCKGRGPPSPNVWVYKDTDHISGRKTPSLC